MSTESGRKYAIARLAIWIGFSVCMFAIMAIMWKDPKPGEYIASIVGDFANILMVGVSAFTVTNAAISGVAVWKQGNKPSVKTETKTEIIGQPPTPPEEDNG